MLKKNGPQLSHFLLIYNLVLHVCREARPRGLTGVWTLRQLEDIKRHEVLLNKFIFNTYRAFFYKSKFYEFFFSYRCINSLFFLLCFCFDLCGRLWSRPSSNRRIWEEQECNFFRDLNV